MKIGERILEKVVDVVLIAVYFNMETLTHKRKEWGRVENYVYDDLEKFDYGSVKRLILYLKQKGLVQVIREKSKLPEITDEGKKKLASVLPSYNEKRVWDKRVYLITYDLPTKKNTERNYLRFFLKKIGCGMLQKSVWITPYNPTELIDQFVKKNELTDLILVSSLGKDGTVGKINFSDLFADVYGLRELNERYKEFIFEYNKGKLTKDQLIFYFLNILANDPQIPFPLLPEEWVGDKAYKLFLNITH